MNMELHCRGNIVKRETVKWGILMQVTTSYLNGETGKISYVAALCRNTGFHETFDEALSRGGKAYSRISLPLNLHKKHQVHKASWMMIMSQATSSHRALSFFALSAFCTKWRKSENKNSFA